MNAFIANFTNTIDLIKLNLPFVIQILAVLWIIQVVNFLLGYRLNRFGLVPRHLRGAIGIATAPFLHADFNHIFFNSIPLFVLANFVILSGKTNFFCISIFIIVVGGAALWLLGRRAIHIGASGVISGYMGYLLMNVYANPGVLSVVLAAVVLYYFGTIILGLLPSKEGGSWEGHLFGFLAGLAASVFCTQLNVQSILSLWS